MFTPRNLMTLRKEEMTELLRNTVDICYQNDADALNINIQVEALKTIVDQLDGALLYEREKEFTKELETLDSDRDDAIKGLRYGFIMNTYHQHPKVKEAAQTLLDRVDSYGSRIARMNYESESAAIINLINDFETEENLKAALQRLGLQNWVDRLKIANQKFRTLYTERITEESKKNKTSFSAIRPEAMTVYTNLINRINAYVVLDEEKKYESINNELITLTDRYHQIISNRKRNSSEETDQVVN
ncbi:DUF6261 family protein [Aquimarina sp. 2201CG1-2-11]|uniref:DUF6261 family protein n=1 Tax=Aquimarina discodermiae TaxID=3231043 RepID=UPI003462BF7B